MARDYRPHAITLDICLLDIDGFRVLERLKNDVATRHIAVTVVSTEEARSRAVELGALDFVAKPIHTRDEVVDRVKGLELGGDDYLIKPFAFAELLARVRTLLRRGTAIESEVLRVADLELDLVRRRASRSGRRITLTGKEFALLELLLRRRDEVLPRSLIASQVWDMNFDSDTNVIDVAIRRLRAKIDDSFEPKLIHTVRGMGYMLDAAGEG